MGPFLFSLITTFTEKASLAFLLIFTGAGLHFDSEKVLPNTKKRPL